MHGPLACTTAPVLRPASPPPAGSNGAEVAPRFGDPNAGNVDDDLSMQLAGDKGALSPGAGLHIHSDFMI